MDKIRERHPGAFQDSTASTAVSCPKCGGLGWYARPFDHSRGVQEAVLCECKAAERSKRLMEASGLGRALETQRMDNYQHTKPYQQTMYSAAKGFLESAGDDWLYLGGQPGCGKTHLCTAVCGELLRRGTAVRYMMWTKESTKIRTWGKNPEVLDEVLEPYKWAETLYVDDLLKGAQKRDGILSISEAEDKLAFDLFNHRYVTGLRTIISCEWDLDDLVDLDQGTFSRVFERCRRFNAQIGMDRAKNYRLQEEHK